MTRLLGGSLAPRLQTARSADVSGNVSRVQRSRAKRSVGEPDADGSVDRFLDQPPFSEDESMEEAHVHDEQLHGEQRFRFAVTQALATGHEHR